MAQLVMQGHFVDYGDRSHNLTNFSQDIYFKEGTNQISGVNFAYNGFYHIELENAHYEDFPEFHEFRESQINPFINITPNDMNQKVVVNFVGNGEVIQRFEFTPEEFSRIILYASEDGQNLDVVAPCVCPF